MERLGLEDRADSPVETLSHGNQQRVQLAVSLAFEADVLVLDEPFSGLDPIAVNTMGEVIREEAARGVAVLFSSHQLDLVEDLCDDVVIIDRGRVVLSGALAEVRAGSPFRYVEVSGPAAATPWFGGLPGAELVRERDASVRVRIPSQTDPAAVLEAARRQGAVVGFSFEPPTLSDLFVEAVRR
jgi:ABC-2 type transport system ATP-binding protein